MAQGSGEKHGPAQFRQHRPDRCALRAELRWYFGDGKWLANPLHSQHPSAGDDLALCCWHQRGTDIRSYFHLGGTSIFSRKLIRWRSLAACLARLPLPWRPSLRSFARVRQRNNRRRAHRITRIQPSGHWRNHVAAGAASEKGALMRRRLKRAQRQGRLSSENGPCRRELAAGKAGAAPAAAVAVNGTVGRLIRYGPRSLSGSARQSGRRAESPQQQSGFAQQQRQNKAASPAISTTEGTTR